MKNLVNPGNKAPSNLADTTILEERISFSFQFFRQIENFGLGNCNKDWYLLLVNSLSGLSQMTCKELSNQKKVLHYHKIDWTQKHIPIQPEQLDWIPKNFRNNLWQLHITTSNGRIIGFIYNNIFYIVLLDPEHNMQPCKKNNYHVTKTQIGVSDLENSYEELSFKYNELIELIKTDNYDKLKDTIKTHSQEYRTIVYTAFDTEEDFQWYVDSTEGMSFQEVIDEYLILKDDAAK